MSTGTAQESDERRGNCGRDVPSCRSAWPTTSQTSLPEADRLRLKMLAEFERLLGRFSAELMDVGGTSLEAPFGIVADLVSSVVERRGRSSLFWKSGHVDIL